MAGSRLKKGQVYWMAGSTFKEGQVYWMAGSTLKEGAGLLDGWDHIKGMDRFTGWLAIH